MALLGAGLTPEQVDEFIVNLPNFPGGKALSKSLDSGGVDFSLDAIQTGLNSLEPAFVAAYGEGGGLIVAALKSIGVASTPKWQTMGLASEPTLEEIAAAKEKLAVVAWAADLYSSQIQAVYLSLESWAHHVQSQYLSPMSTQGSSISEIKAAINADEQASAIDSLISQLNDLKTLINS